MYQAFSKQPNFCDEFASPAARCIVKCYNYWHNKPYLRAAEQDDIRRFLTFALYYGRFLASYFAVYLLDDVLLVRIASFR